VKKAGFGAVRRPADPGIDTNFSSDGLQNVRQVDAERKLGSIGLHLCFCDAKVAGEIPRAQPAVSSKR
jgi:hypothetical protein